MVQVEDVVQKDSKVILMHNLYSLYECKRTLYGNKLFITHLFALDILSHYLHIQ